MEEKSNLEAQIRELTFLHETSQVLTATLDLDDILRSLMTQVRDYFGVDAASVALLDEDTQDLVFRVAVGRASDEVVGFRIRPGQGIVGWVVQTGQPALVPVVEEDERFYAGVDRRTSFRTQALLAVPVKVEGQSIGVIEVLNPAGGDFDKDAERLLLAVADLAAIALRNAALYERVRQAERRYESLFNESTDPILVLDLEGRILNLNQRAVEMLDRSREQLCGTDFCQMLGVAREKCRQAILRAREGERLKMDMSLMVSMPSGIESRMLETTLARIDYGGREAIQWVGHDISERVALEQTREDLMHMIVHDLRNPLGSMMSSLQLIQDGLVDDSGTVPLVKLIDIAVRGGQRMYRLIDSLLDLGRMEAGETELRKVDVSPANLVQEAVEQVYPLAMSRGQTLTAEVEPDLPRVWADEEFALRILANLIDNAVKFTPLGGRITVVAKHGNDEILFGVTDTGPGIPSESRQRVFDRFARLQSAEDVAGSGIGLAFCKLAVEAHQGRIWVESEPGRGSTFYFTLPLEAGEDSDHLPED
jgi:NtrC-family two-component system sensor histidine kinase KinB